MTIVSAIKRPRPVQCIQWTGGNWEALRAFAGDSVRMDDRKQGHLMVRPQPHLAYSFHMQPGFWLIQATNGTWDVESNDMFTRLYEVQNEGSAQRQMETIRD